VEKLDILCYWWRHADIIFLCKIVGFTVEDRYMYLMKCLYTSIGHCVNWTQKYANLSHNFPLCTVSWFIFLAEYGILNFADAGRHTHTASLHGWPLARYQLNGSILLVISILFKSFIPSIFNCPSVVRKHLAQSCGSITLADSQTCLSLTVKPIIYKCKNMTSAWAKNI